MNLCDYFDYETNMYYIFHYKNSRSPYAVTIKGEYLYKLLGVSSYTFQCGTEQIGSLKILARNDGVVVKEIMFDSFGNILSDTLPKLFLPIFFAGGLRDKHTELIRFTVRDYDPCIGRFVSLDPANDLRGDGDLQDYCVDDPVSLVDPSGLWFDFAGKYNQVKEFVNSFKPNYDDDFTIKEMIGSAILGAKTGGKIGGYAGFINPTLKLPMSAAGAVLGAPIKIGIEGYKHGITKYKRKK